MEERNLLRIHQQTLKRKKSVLREEICRVNPLHSSDEEAQPLLVQLEQDIVQWSEHSENGDREVVGGVLYQYTVKNISASKEHCERLFKDLVTESKVQEKVENAVSKSKCLDIQDDIRHITEEYNRRAVGPSASEVLERGLSELSQLSDILEKIPGSPRNVQVIGVGSDRIKLSWDPPERNPEAVDEYLVCKKAYGGGWEEAVRTEKRRVLVKGLETGTSYEMCVLATNSQILGRARERANVWTKPGAADGAAHGAFACLPGVGLIVASTGKLKPLSVPQGARRQQLDNSVIKRKRRNAAVAGLAIITVSLPFSVFIAPFAPVGAVVCAVGAMGSKTGDLTEE